MLFNLFNYFFSREGQYPDNRVYSILVSGIVCYGIIAVVIKNLIYFYNISENFYWGMVFILGIDIMMFFKSNMDFINRKLQNAKDSINEYFIYIKKPRNNNEINETENNKKNNKKIKNDSEISNVSDIIDSNDDLEKKLLEDEIYITSVIV